MARGGRSPAARRIPWNEPTANLRPLAGRPLIAHTLDMANGCAEIDRTVVSTDSEEIAEVALALSAEVPFLRPADLASDDSSMIEHHLVALGIPDAVAAEAADNALRLSQAS